MHAIPRSVLLLLTTFSLAGAAPWRFVSIPDFLNADIGDIMGLASYDGGPNSTTPAYEAAIDFLINPSRSTSFRAIPSLPSFNLRCRPNYRNLTPAMDDSGSPGRAICYSR